MENADEFLNQYRILEEELCRKYNFDEKTFGSPVVRFINDKESVQFRDKLNLCREIRNLLSHHSEFEGEPIIEPSTAMINFLKEVTDYVRRPPLALNFATLYDDIMKTNPSQKAQVVMRKMERLGFSHVPVISEGEFVGVFSVSTVFTYIISKNMTSLNDDMTIGDFAELLPVERHSSEKFQFVGKDATLFEVKQAFENKTQRNKRLAVIFITDNGSKGGRILGMLTPWDILRNA
ncbi:MAG: CBS domain-containing protein [Acutalibacteraceae bacterium]